MDDPLPVRNLRSAYRNAFIPRRCRPGAPLSVVGLRQRGVLEFDARSILGRSCDTELAVGRGVGDPEWDQSCAIVCEVPTDSAERRIAVSSSASRLKVGPAK